GRGGCTRRVPRSSPRFATSSSRSGTKGSPRSKGLRNGRRGGDGVADEAERLQQGGDVIEREVRIEAAPDTVFELLTDPEQYVRWKGRKAWLDATPGGEFKVEINDQ